MTRPLDTRLIVCGANDIAARLCWLGHHVGLHVTVCDPRSVFATPARFPSADEVVVAWPQRYLANQISEGGVGSRTALVTVDVEDRFDVPVLQVALQGPPLAYVGAAGGARLCRGREDRLRARGVTNVELSRLRRPVELAAEARSPAAVALLMADEIVTALRAQHDIGR